MITRRSALRSGLVLGALASTATIATQCTPTEAPAAGRDPLLELIMSYREQMAIYLRAPADVSDEEDDALAAATYRPFFDALNNEPPSATTLAGVEAALRLVVEEENRLTDWCPTFAVLEAAKAYFDGRTA